MFIQKRSNKDYKLCINREMPDGFTEKYRFAAKKNKYLKFILSTKGNMI